MHAMQPINAAFLGGDGVIVNPLAFDICKSSAWTWLEASSLMSVGLCVAASKASLLVRLCAWVGLVPEAVDFGDIGDAPAEL